MTFEEMDTLQSEQENMVIDDITLQKHIEALIDFCNSQELCDNCIYHTTKSYECRLNNPFDWQVGGAFNKED